MHVFIKELVAQANNLPIAGTPAWCGLADDDPNKLIALAAAGEHHVLRTEIGQEIAADASCEVSKAADWSAVARRIRQRAEVYIPRKAS